MIRLPAMMVRLLEPAAEGLQRQQISGTIHDLRRANTHSGEHPTRERLPVLWIRHLHGGAQSQSAQVPEHVPVLRLRQNDLPELDRISFRVVSLDRDTAQHFYVVSCFF